LHIPAFIVSDYAIKVVFVFSRRTFFSLP